MRKLIKKYLEIWGYDVNNSKGNSCWLLNTIDFILLLFYIGIVMYNTWNYRISDLIYVATAILSCRALMKFWIKEVTFKKDGASVSMPYTIGIIIYLFLTFILIICYFYFGNGQKIFLLIYYILFAIFEITEVLTIYFDAEPHKYKRN